MPLEKLPHEIVGRHVLGRFAEECDGGLPAWPGVAAAVDRYQDHFAAVLSRAVGLACHPRPVPGRVRHSFHHRLGLTAVGLHPCPYGIVHRIEIRGRQTALTLAAAKWSE